jgi:ATP synthase subunit 6
MLHSPLEQFEIIPLIPLRRGALDLSFTNSSLMRVLTAGILRGRAQSVRVVGNGRLVPTRMQTAWESVHQLVLSMVGQTIGPQGAPLFPIIFSIFTFILGCNRFGLVPYSFTVTSHLIVTMTLGLAIWIGKLVMGFRLHGWSFFRRFLPSGTPFAMIGFMVPLELMGFTITFISLSVRLFANMMAGHILLKVIGGFAWTMMVAGGAMWVAHFLPRIVLFLLLGLETAVAFIQAYVFSLRACIYISDSISGGH